MPHVKHMVWGFNMGFYTMMIIIQFYYYTYTVSKPVACQPYQLWQAQSDLYKNLQDRSILVYSFPALISDKWGRADDVVLDYFSCFIKPDRILKWRNITVYSKIVYMKVSWHHKQCFFFWISIHETNILLDLKVFATHVTLSLLILLHQWFSLCVRSGRGNIHFYR